MSAFIMKANTSFRTLHFVSSSLHGLASFRQSTGGILQNQWKTNCRSQRPRGLRRRSAAARLLRSWVRIPPVTSMFVFCECCVLSGRGLCDALITRPEESYRLRCVVVCDLETSKLRRPFPALGRSVTGKRNGK